MFSKKIKEQRGTTMFLVLVFMLGMFTMIGLAMTTGRLVTDKTKLQNALDATALSAAITILKDGRRNAPGQLQNAIDNANAKARETFTLFKGTAGNTDLADVDANHLVFKYSETLKPETSFSVTPAKPPNFVRVSIAGKGEGGDIVGVPVTPLWLGAINAETIGVGGVATAGAVVQRCDLQPFILCAKDTSKTNPADTTTDSNCADDTNGDGLLDCFGFNVGKQINLIQPKCTNGAKSTCTLDSTTSLESGNFNLADLDTAGGGFKEIEDYITGNKTTSFCGGSTINTKPGKRPKPLADAITGRFDQDGNKKVEKSGSTYTYKYINYSNSTAPDLPNYMRVMPVTVANCAGIQNGASVPVTKVGTACLFLLDRANMKTEPGVGSLVEVWTELFASCQQEGSWDPTKQDNVGLGPYDVVLFKSAGSGDS